MAVIGLTGNIGSGKTTVCQLLAARGCLCLNADLLGRSVSEPGGEAYEQLRQSFGAEFFSPERSEERRVRKECSYQCI